MKAPDARKSAVGKRTLRSLLVFASAAVNSLLISRFSPTGMELKIQPAFLVRPKMGGGKLKLEIHALI